MTTMNRPARPHHRSSALHIRAALTTAEGVASKLCDKQEADVQTQAQALLHRLAAIRAEVDLLEQLAISGSRRSLRRPEAGPRRSRSRP